MSSIMNKIKEVVQGDSKAHDNKAHDSAPEGTSGPHNSRIANAADPRIDSDRDGSRTMGTNTGRTAGPLGSTGGTTGYGSHTHGTSEGLQGPHNSRVANTLDPRVDSDRDGSNTFGNTGRTAGPLGSTGAAATGFGSGTHGTHSTHGTSEGHYGPHSSRVGNTLDPRVDSDRDGSNTFGNTGRTAGGLGSTGTTGGTYGTGYHSSSGISGMTGTHSNPTGTHGSAHPHNSRVGYVPDPRGNPDRDGRMGALGSTGSGPGPAPNTAGPHKSDLANKLDPRVDSDRDGSKTIGQDKTYQ